MTEESKEYIYTFTEVEEEKIRNAKLQDDLNLFKTLRDLGFSTINSIYLFNDLTKKITLKQSFQNLLEKYDASIESPYSHELPEG